MLRPELHTWYSNAYCRTGAPLSDVTLTDAEHQVCEKFLQIPTTLLEAVSLKVDHFWRHLCAITVADLEVPFEMRHVAAV